jgi:uncharacterized membrane protein
MVLMAIDHVRVYSGLPPGGPTAGIFFTRWITHFVAPAFVFFAGTAAYLHGRKLPDAMALSRFLIIRGAWLIMLELTVIRVAWTFNLDFRHYMLAGVIWMIGWCMILLAGAIHLPRVAVGALGVAIIALHNLADMVPSIAGLAYSGNATWLLKVLYLGGAIQLGANGPPLLVLFVIVPWVGVMLAGYAFGPVMTMSPEQRRAVCLRLGVALIAAFLLLRFADVYGDPRHWRLPSSGASLPASSHTPAPLRFLGTTKYPASLDFLLMTLGPLFVLLGLVERARGRVAEWLRTFGRVPFFYYLLHIPVIHAAACVVSLAREGRVDPWLFGNHPMAPAPVPPGYTWSLALLYFVFAVCVVILYFPCRWFARLRATRRYPWLSYL